MGGSKKDLEKFRGGRGEGWLGGRVGPRGDPQIHQNPKRSGVSNFDENETGGGFWAF